MRRARSFLIPVSMITFYYLAFIALVTFLLMEFPQLHEYFPIGGISDLAGRNTDDFEAVYSSVNESILSPHGAIRLAISTLGAGVLIIPVSWVYFITSRDKKVDQSFLQTIILMPIVVTGISMIVLNSLALAFSLAGIVAAVRFRFTLDQPAHAMYIFVAIAIGLGSGIGALAVTTVISMSFVYANLTIWKLEYGKKLGGPFLAMLTRRDELEDDY